MNETSDTPAFVPDDQPGECLLGIPAHMSKASVAVHYDSAFALTTAA